MIQLRVLTTMSTVVLCIGMLLLVACGADDEVEPTTTSQGTPSKTAQRSGNVDACSLLTEAEAADAVGGATDPPKSSVIGENFSQCVWRIQGGAELGSAVIVQARGDTSDDDFERFVDENTPEVVGEVTTIDDLGDKAYQQIATFVLSGDSMVVVTVLNNETPEQQEQRQHDLARAAIGRLP
jgi:hypothetical protein